MELKSEIYRLLQSGVEANAQLGFELCKGMELLHEIILEHISLLEFFWSFQLINRHLDLDVQVAHLYSFQKLEIKHKNIETLPKTIGKLIGLKRIDLSYNQLEFLPSSIKDIKQLEWLNLRRNSIPKTEQEKIKQWLPNTLISF